MLSVTCGEEGCEGGSVNCGIDGVLCSACGVVGGGGASFGSSSLENFSFLLFIYKHAKI